MSYKGFNSVKLTRPQRSTFDLSHEKRLSTRMGRLTPVFISETMPNDTFTCNSEVMLRLAPMLAPIMHRVNVFVHFFFVPNRILWEDWEDFITAGRLGTETPPVPPYMMIADNANGGLLEEGADLLDVGSLYDYLGGAPIPDSAVANWQLRKIDMLPFAAYTKVWYDYYRDRNYVSDLTDSGGEYFPMPSGDVGNDFYGGDFRVLTSLRTRAWQHDYFTSALPFTQRGSEVLMPLDGTGSVTYLDRTLVKDEAGNLISSNTLLGNDSGTGNEGELNVNRLTAGTWDGGSAVYGRIENIDEVNLTSSDVSINDLRRAVRLQEWLERNALAGSRYNESIMAHFGRATSDARLQRAEYLGGGKVAVNISEVVTTAYSSDGTDTIPPVNMAGHGLSIGKLNKFSYNCEEHGFVIGIMSVMPVSSYMQGIPRMFFQRNTFLDYPWPSFANLGEQEVFDYELYAEPATVPVNRNEAPVFGYQSRYSDWKQIQSSSHGEFRTTLDFWHLTRKFSALPELGDTFVKFEDALQDRVFAAGEAAGDTLWCYIYNDVFVKRSLPYYGTPNL